MTTSKNSQAQDFLPMELPLMSSQEDSLARKSVLWAVDGFQMACQKIGAVYGLNTSDSLAKYDLSLSSWRTRQACLLEDWTEFSDAWPRSGLMRNGIVYRLPTLAPTISEIGSGLLPTPAATDWKGVFRLETILRRASELKIGVRLPEHLGRVTGKVGRPNPRFWEKLMMYPIGWTELED